MKAAPIEADVPPGLAADRPTAHVVATCAGRVVARCSCWWGTAPVSRGLAIPMQGSRIGLIGHYHSDDQHAGLDVLARACERLAREGCTTAVGPVDGSTWRRYRFVTERGVEPRFFLEPDNDDRWPDEWAAAGLVPVAGYHSSVTEDLRATPSREEHEARMRARGVSIRVFDSARPDDDLRVLHDLSARSFRDHTLYSPIGEGEFIAQYRPLLPAVRADLVTIAEHDGQPIGFLFAIPDALEARRRPHARIETVVVKTLALVPEWQGVGLGSLLLARTHRAAAALGFTRAIHALMQDDNVSGVLSGRTARPFRRYGVFGVEL